MKLKIILTAFVVAILFFKGFSQPLTFESRGIGGGGALFSPSVNPKNNDEIYLSCDMSEIFHTSNKGESWQILNFKKIQGGHNSKISFTNNDNIMYCIDYTSVNGVDYSRPVKSTDGGLTWNLLPGNPYPNDEAFNITADYDNPNNVILGFYGEIFFSNNGGSTFKKIYTCKSNDEGNHIAGTFFDADKIYIGLNDGLLVSTDAGANFNLMTTTGMPSTEKMLSFSGAKEGSNVRFVCLTLTNVWAGIQHAFEYSAGNSAAMQGIYVMDNADGTWKSKLSGINKSTDFPVFTGMSQNNISIIYVSGGSSSGAPIVMKSSDGGNNWNHVFKTSNNQNIFTGWSGYNGDRQWSYGECPFGFCVSPNNSNMLIFTDFGFAHASYDGGTNWKQMYVDNKYQNPQNSSTPKGKSYKGIGLENTTNWNILWIDSTNMLSSFSDINGVMSNDKGVTWKFIPNLTQNSVYHIVKSNTGTLYAATSNIHDIYQSTRLSDAILDAGTGAIYISNDKATSFTLMHNFNHPVVWLALDPTNSKRMYASVIHSTAGGIFVSNDIDKGAASTWSKLSNPPRTEGHPFVIIVLKNGDLVVSYSGRRGTLFTASSGVFYSKNQGASWTDVSDNNMKYWTKDVVIDPSDTSQSTWYAAVFSGWGSSVPPGTGGLYRTINKGQNWTKISNSSSSYRVNSCTVNPQNNDELYYTTETDGLWFTKNATSPMPEFSLVSGYPFRHPVRVNFNPYKNSEIWVSSFGGGMMVGNNNGGNNSFNKIKNLKNLKIYPNPAEYFIQLNMTGTFDYEIYNLHGSLVAFGKNSGSDEYIKVDTLQKGIYTIKVKSEERNYFSKFLKI
ncbi:MAG: T9SS type A sorting domain-containing protein [Bacteroidetes bacterium]|nr:T9SS type A sorting domain-containing protein [Bacteroidota bacterium]